MPLDLRDYLKQAPEKVLIDHFGHEPYSFTVTVHACTRPEMEAMRLSARRIVQRKNEPAQETHDIKVIRRFLADKCLRGWSGLTGEKVAYWCNTGLTGTPADQEEVEFSPEGALALMEGCLAFESWVFSQASELSEQLAVEDAAAKNA